MRKLFYLLTLLSLAMVSCEKEPFLSVSLDAITAPAEGNTTTITVNSNNPWNVAGQSWCTVSPSSGEGGECYVTITVKGNTTYDKRSCTLNFSSEGLTSSVSVNQESNLGVVLPINSYEISSDVQELTIEVKANIEYEVTIDSDWIKLNETKALASKTYTFDIEANTSYDAREGTITIREKNGTSTEIIKIKQSQLDAIIIENKEYSISNEAQTLNIELQTNIDFEVIIPDESKDWISHVETKALVNKNILLSIGASYLNNARKGNIYIANTTSGLKDTITIKQKGTQPANEIWYFTTDGNIANPREPEAFGANILSNIYTENGKCIITFDKPITTIGNFAFSNCQNLLDIYIPENVTSIGNGAFWYCTNLCHVSMPECVTSIGYSAFLKCMFGSIELPENLTVIGNGAFTDNINLSTITIPKNIKHIGDDVFAGCMNLRSAIDIPEAIEYIGSNPFSGCPIIKFTGKLSSEDGKCLIKDGKLIAFTISGNTETYNIPDDVTSIGNKAFYGAESLTSITFNNNITYIGDGGFSGCKSIIEINLPKEINNIGQDAFAGCKNLVSITLPEKIDSIKSWTFGSCESLKEITIPKNVKYIGTHAFTSCVNLESINLSENLSVMDMNIFRNCTSLKSIIIPQKITSLSSGIFYGCSNLSSIILPENLTYIGQSTFNGCKSLTNIELPININKIDYYCFYDCSNLTEVISKTTNAPTLGENAFKNISDESILKIPKGSKASYENSEWKNYFSLIEEIQ